jgi:hypothetical protein
MGSSLQCTIFKGCSYEPSLVYISSLNQRHTLSLVLWHCPFCRLHDRDSTISAHFMLKIRFNPQFSSLFLSLFKGTVEWHGFFTMQSDQGWRYYFRLVFLNSKWLNCPDILYIWRYIHVELQKSRNVSLQSPTKINMKNPMCFDVLLLEYAQ